MREQLRERRANVRVVRDEQELLGSARGRVPIGVPALIQRS
jgi:hypothetical protein